MKTNVGETDKVIRLIISIFLIGGGLAYSNIWIIILGVIILITAATGKCALYQLLGISTVKKERKEI